MYISKTIDGATKLVVKKGLSFDERLALFGRAIDLIRLGYSYKNQEISLEDILGKHLQYVFGPEYEGIRFVDGQGGKLYVLDDFWLHSLYYNTKEKFVLVLCRDSNPSAVPLGITCMVMGSDDEHSEMIEGWYVEDDSPSVDVELII